MHIYRRRFDIFPLVFTGFSKIKKFMENVFEKIREETIFHFKELCSYCFSPI